MKKNAFLLGLCIAIYYIIKLYGRAGTEVILDDVEQLRVNNELVEAAKRNDYNAVVMLVRVDGADVDSVDTTGKTGLMWSAWNSDISTAEKMITLRPNLNLQDNDGNTAAHLALLPSPDQVVNSEERVNASDYQVLRMILAAGADPNIRNNLGKTILDYAQDKEVQDLMTRQAIKMIRRYLAKYSQEHATFKQCAGRKCTTSGPQQTAPQGTMVQDTALNNTVLDDAALSVK